MNRYDSFSVTADAKSIKLIPVNANTIRIYHCYLCDDLFTLANSSTTVETYQNAHSLRMIYQHVKTVCSSHGVPFDSEEGISRLKREAECYKNCNESASIIRNAMGYGKSNYLEGWSEHTIKHGTKGEQNIPDDYIIRRVNINEEQIVSLEECEWSDLFANE